MFFIFSKLAARASLHAVRITRCALQHALVRQVFQSMMSAVAVAYATTSQILKFIVSFGGDTYRNMRCAWQHCKWSRIGRRIPDETEIAEVAESLMRMLENHFETPPPLYPSPSEEPLAVTDGQPSKQCLSKQSLMHKHNMFGKQSHVVNHSRRVDSPAPTRKRQSMREASQDMIIFTRPEPVKKSDSKRVASPAPKVQKEKPRGPENWGDDADEASKCKAATLLTMLNDASEEMLCDMIKSITASSAKKIVDYRSKNGDFTCISQIDIACQRGFAHQLLKAV